jgi:hypothetical protein
MQAFADGFIEVTAADLPSFLYENGTVYNPDDEVTGLFRGFLLVRVQDLLLYCQLFTFDTRFFATYLLDRNQHLGLKKGETRTRPVFST